MSRLILKSSRSSGEWKDEHYDVLADGKVIGRILESGSRFDPPELRWGWSITAVVTARPGVTRAQDFAVHAARIARR